MNILIIQDIKCQTLTIPGKSSDTSQLFFLKKKKKKRGRKEKSENFEFEEIHWSATK
jgi:hypothetical protein